ncbi:MAG: hypothetical protein IJH12_06225 [Clostridia bacterium]|nr:hypothetical protein [Clostridia bacterium]
MEGKEEERIVQSDKTTQDISSNIAVSALLKIVMSQIKSHGSYKNISKNTIDTLSNLPDEILFPILYNLILGPAYKMKTAIDESDQKIDDAVVAVYGAIFPLARKRVVALEALSKKVDLSNGIILSGGRTWTGSASTIMNGRDKVRKDYNDENSGFRKKVDLAILRRLAAKRLVIDGEEKSEEAIKEQNTAEIVRKICGDDVIRKIRNAKSNDLDNEIIDKMNELKNSEEGSLIWEEELEEVLKYEVKEIVADSFFGNPDKLNRAYEKAVDITELLPEIKEYLHDRDAKIWNEELAKRKEEYAGRKTVPRDSLPEFKNYDEMYSAHINKKVDKVMNNSLHVLQHYYSKYCEYCIKKDLNAGIMDTGNNEFRAWLYKYFDNKFRLDQIVHGITEVELMQLVMKKISIPTESLDIIEDKKALKTPENADNTIEEFLKLKKKNPKLKKIIVVSDWQYLLRQVLTTIQAAKKAGLGPDDVSIMGYPANAITKEYGNQEIALDCSAEVYRGLLLGELKNIINYTDVDNMDIPSDINQHGNGPVVMVDKQKLQDYLQGLNRKGKEHEEQEKHNIAEATHEHNEPHTGTDSTDSNEDR